MRCQCTRPVCPRCPDCLKCWACCQCRWMPTDRVDDGGRQQIAALLAEAVVRAEKGLCELQRALDTVCVASVAAELRHR